MGMAWRTESLLLELIKYREQELAAGADTGGDEWLRAYVELADLQSELEFVRDNPAALDDPDAVSVIPAQAPSTSQFWRDRPSGTR